MFNTSSGGPDGKGSTEYWEQMGLEAGRETPQSSSSCLNVDTREKAVRKHLHAPDVGRLD